MSTRASTSASRRTPFTVHAMHPKGRHLHPFDWIGWRGSWRAGPARRTLGRWWLLSCTCILGREGQDVQPFGASHGRGEASTGVVQEARLRRRSCSRWSGNRAMVSETMSSGIPFGRLWCRTVGGASALLAAAS